MMLKKLISETSLQLKRLWNEQDGFFDVTSLIGFMAFGDGTVGTPSPAPAGIVESVEQVSISIAAAATSNTATISSVTTSRSIVIFNGTTNDTTSDSSGQFCRLDLTNSTTVTATRTNSTGNLVVKGFVIQFKSGTTNSVQQGTITVAGISTTTNTATISSVNTSYSAVFYQGVSGAGTSGAENNYLTNVELTNSTTVTATRSNSSTGNDVVLGYVVVEFSSSYIQSVQHVTVTLSAVASNTATISSVTTANCMTAYGHFRANDGDPDCFGKLTLTNSTTVTASHSTTSTSFHKCVIVEFISGVITSVQRRTITIQDNVTSTTDTITSIDTAKSIVNYTGYSADGDNPAEAACTVVITDSTTLTVAKAGLGSLSSDDNILNCEVIEWVV